MSYFKQSQPAWYAREKAGEKGIMAHENARETWCSTWTDDSWAKLNNFVVQKRDRC